jgi:L-ascorbate metabolism protein UlaG (beta-lactamase superfamily)
MGFRNVQTFDGWWQTFSLENAKGKTLSITPVPARHWSGRTGLDTNQSPWAGFAFQSGNKTAYYAGDTAYDERYFQEIKNHFPTIDLALVPIGPCEPRELMKGSHMDPGEAVKSLKILRPQIATAVHYGTYGLGPDSSIKPVDLLNKTWGNEQNAPQLQHTHLKMLPIGGRLDIRESSLRKQENNSDALN